MPSPSPPCATRTAPRTPRRFCSTPSPTACTWSQVPWQCRGVRRRALLCGGRHDPGAHGCDRGSGQRQDHRRRCLCRRQPDLAAHRRTGARLVPRRRRDRARCARPAAVPAPRAGGRGRRGGCGSRQWLRSLRKANARPRGWRRAHEQRFSSPSPAEGRLGAAGARWWGRAVRGRVPGVVTPSLEYRVEHFGDGRIRWRLPDGAVPGGPSTQVEGSS